MIVSFTLFIVSFAGIVAMLILRLHKMNTGKTFVIFRSGHKLDGFLKRKAHEFHTILSFFNRRTARLLFHYVLDKIEAKVVKLKDASHHKAKTLIEKAKAKETKIEAGKQASEFISKIKK